MRNLHFALLALDWKKKKNEGLVDVRKFIQAW